MPESSIEWLDARVFPQSAPASFRGRPIRVGWHPDLKKLIVNFQGVAPSAEDIAWAEAYISTIAEELGVDPDTKYRVIF